MWSGRIITVFAAAGIAGAALSIDSVLAAPPGGGTSATRFSVVELPVKGDPVALGERGPSDAITVPILSDDAGRSSAAFAKIDASTRAVLAAGFLPEPPYVDPNDGMFKNGPSSPFDVNALGEIVGGASAFDPDSTGDPSPTQAILWVDDGARYSYVPLPMFTNTTSSIARGINNWGDIVGISQGITNWTAVFWDADSLAVVDLNTAATAALGWELRAAYDINDAGLIVGSGRLNGVVRGFLLDRQSGSIWPVPLIGLATSNMAYKISASGRVIGDAWDGDGVPYGTNPNYYRSYSWSGPGTNPALLTSITGNTSLAVGLNDLGASVGNSIVPSDGLFSEYVPTLWEFDAQGKVIATDLKTAISKSSPYTLRSAGGINNDGWVTVAGRKAVKGKVSYPALLLIPN